MRIRITYAKTGSLIYTGNLDIQRLWERVFRRADLRLQYSQGFHPQPRIQIGNPLPLGFTGSNEMVDVWLETDQSTADIREALTGKFPCGLLLKSIEIVPDHAPALVNLVISADYLVHLVDEKINIEEIKEKIDSILRKTSIPRVRNRKNYDLRPLILSLSAKTNENAQIEIPMSLCSSPAKTGRPDEVMFEMGFGPEDFRVERTSLNCEGTPQ